MNQRLTPATALLLTLPPLLWAGNAVVGRVVHELIPPMTLNFLRWALAFVILLPLAWRVLRPDSAMWRHWKRFSLLGLLGIGCYNALQYLALQTSAPLNVTLVASSIPVWMLMVGALCFGRPVSRRQMAGALLSIAGVLVVLARGQWDLLVRVRLVPGDMYVLVATLAWAFYSWLLIQPKEKEPLEVRSDWAAFLMAQIVFGVGWSALFAGGEWALTDARITWGWPLVAALLYIAVGPAVISYRCWGLGVQRVGPAIASFFANLTPLFAALLSAAFLGELPHLYHALAFFLIVSGIVVSARR
ncbi:MAG: DMT family transporter [Burkholderiales bacterium]|jgi:drug/metabolite transporter (DMT)-like permease|nr:DMT family transporter [Burkholderiales bacterium]MBH2018652.1 DMT family transporter [Burkholderiales bacterium]